MFCKEGEYLRAEECLKKTQAVGEDGGNVYLHFESLLSLAYVKIEEEKTREAVSYLFSAIEKCKKMCGCLQDSNAGVNVNLHPGTRWG